MINKLSERTEDTSLRIFNTLSGILKKHGIKKYDCTIKDGVLTNDEEIIGVSRQLQCKTTEQRDFLQSLFKGANEHSEAGAQITQSHVKDNKLPHRLDIIVRGAGIQPEQDALIKLNDMTQAAIWAEPVVD